MNYNELWNEISNSLFTHVKHLINRAPYDKTFKAKVLKKLSDGKYQILYKNARYTARYHGLVIPGETVHVCAPKNNWSELFILDGNHDKIEDTSLANIIAEDTSGVFGALGAEVSAQRLVDWIADQAMHQVLKKVDLVNNALTTTSGVAALDAAMGKTLGDRIDSLNNSKADSNHSHDNRYYTESEMDSKLSGKAASSHRHDDRYYTESEINAKLNQKQNTIKTRVSSPPFDTSNVEENNASVYMRQWGAVVHIHIYMRMKASVNRPYSTYRICTGLPEALYSGYSGALCVDDNKSDPYFYIDHVNPGTLYMNTRATPLNGKVVIGAFTYIAKSDTW
ncbi:hypothetical protein AALB16_10740 [Lachnospiraceae bacterium 62-35]